MLALPPSPSSPRAAAGPVHGLEPSEAVAALQLWDTSSGGLLRGALGGQGAEQCGPPGAARAEAGDIWRGGNILKKEDQGNQVSAKPSEPLS